MKPEPNGLKESLKERVALYVDQIEHLLVDVSHSIHDKPELRFQEFKASALLAGELEREGFQVKRGVANLETAFIARKALRGGRPVIAFIAEYDALPEIGHACGHNLIAASSLGAALAVGSLGQELAGTVALIGTPGEEGGGGKIIMAANGLFRDIDAVMMVHPGNRTWVRTESLAARQFRLKFRGKAAHAAGAPHLGINALDALILTFNGINALRQHVKDDVRIHGIINRGGNAPNIVPDEAEGLFMVRAAEKGYHAEVVERFLNCARGAATATGATLSVEEEGPPYDPMKSNRVMEEVFKENLLALGLAESGMPDGIGSTDMGNLSQVVPAIHPTLALGDTLSAVHSIEFARAARSPQAGEYLKVAAKALACTAIDLLTRPGLLDEVKREFFV